LLAWRNQSADSPNHAQETPAVDRVFPGEGDVVVLEAVGHVDRDGAATGDRPAPRGTFGRRVGGAGQDRPEGAQAKQEEGKRVSTSALRKIRGVLDPRFAKSY